MELIAHPAQGSHFSFHSKPYSRWCNKQKITYRLSSNFFCTSDKQGCLNHRQWRIQPIISKKVKSFKVSSFKGNPCGEGDETTPRGLRFTKKTVQLSYSEEGREETLSEPSDLINPAEDQENIEGSPAMQKLFKKWLVRSRTQAPIPAKEACEDENRQKEVVEPHPTKQTPHTVNLLKAIVLRFWALDATLKVPLLTILPSYFAVKLCYGAEVARELMPVWVVSPLIVAMYTKICQCLLSFPFYCWKAILNFGSRVYTRVIYVAGGKMFVDIERLIRKSIADLKSMDYKELLLQKKDELVENTKDKITDHIESIWPHYCRAIRFLKKANLL